MSTLLSETRGARSRGAVTFGLIAGLLGLAAWYGPLSPVQPAAAAFGMGASPEDAAPGSATAAGPGEEALPQDAAPPQPGQGMAGEALGLGDIDSDAIFADPKARKEMLSQLYDTLAHAADEDSATRLETAISTVWHRTGSPTIDLLLARAESFEEEGNFDMALQILEAASDLAPDTAEVWHQRAMVHYLRDEYSEAIADLRHVLSIDPQHFQAIAGLGRVLEQVGRKKAALAVYRKALKVNPFLDEAKSAVEELSREVEGQDI